MTDDELVAALTSAHQEIAALRWRLDQLEGRTMLTSPSFLKRSFAVLGHYLVASLLVALPIYLIIFIFFLLGLASSR